ncbi:MAG: hypothetical protein P8L91_01845 [Candidatus Marinimicrobia bacterium]|nr:hypothetical protein [Candidatus Neomarinimicrobiota bacterium]
MNNKVIIVITTFIAGIILVQLVSKDQPNSISQDKAPKVKNNPESDFIRIGNLIAKVPDNWNAVKPSSSMRLMEFQIGTNNADASMAVFKNIGGTIDNNLERWAGQFGYQLLDENVRLTNETINGIDFHIISILGTYTNTMAFSSNAAKPKKDYRLLGAIASTSDGLYYFKMTGPNDIINNEIEEFSYFIQSLTYGNIG